MTIDESAQTARADAATIETTGPAPARPVVWLPAALVERHWQVRVHGYTADHDRQHIHAELVSAALAYLTGDPSFWPWPGSPRFGPDDPVTAVTLLLAERDRVAAQCPPRTEGGHPR